MYQYLECNIFLIQMAIHIKKCFSTEIAHHASKWTENLKYFIDSHAYHSRLVSELTFIAK